MILEAGIERNEEEMAIAVLKMLPQHSSQDSISIKVWCGTLPLLTFAPRTSTMHELNSITFWNMPNSMIRWAGHVGCMGQKHTEFWWGNLKERITWNTWVRMRDNTKMNAESKADFSFPLNAIDILPPCHKYTFMVECSGAQTGLPYTAASWTCLI